MQGFVLVYPIEVLKDPKVEKSGPISTWSPAY